MYLSPVADAVPTLSQILRESLKDAPLQARRRAMIGLVAWLMLMVGQLFDSSGRSGPAAVAEFLSAVLGSAGGVLLGLATMLQISAERPADRPDAPPDADAFRRMLLALPAIALTATALLSAAVAFMIVRALLGTPLPFVAIITTLFAALLWTAGATVMRATRTLYAHTRAEAEAAASARAEAGEAQLAALQARMNPHFLFNALNTVASLVRTDPAAAERVTENLSGVLRMTLERSVSRMGTVADEIAYVRAYLGLEQERYGERLEVEWDVDARLLEAPLAPLILQPLVENALRHGLGARIRGGTIRIAVQRSRETALVLTVSDDGVGFPPAPVERTGLGNLRQRLASVYGPRASMQIDRASPGGHVKVTIETQDSAPERPERRAESASRV